MVRVGSLAEALEQIRQGCTELDLQCACPGAALPTHRPRHRRTRMHACRRGGVRRASPERTPHARSPRPHRACARPARAAVGNDISDQAALAAIESILEANKARPRA